MEVQIMGDIEYPIPEEAYIEVLTAAGEKIAECNHIFKEHDLWNILDTTPLNQMVAVVNAIAGEEGINDEDLLDDIGIALGKLKRAQSGNLEAIKEILPKGANVRHVDKHPLEIREFFRKNLPKVINKAKGVDSKSRSEGRGR